MDYSKFPGSRCLKKSSQVSDSTQLNDRALQVRNQKEDGVLGRLSLVKIGPWVQAVFISWPENAATYGSKPGTYSKVRLGLHGTTSIALTNKLI
jgi:hypothetical protein